MVEDKPNDRQVKMTGFAIKGSKAPKRKFVPGGDEGGGPAAEKDLIVAIGDKGIQTLKPKEKEKPKEIAPLSNSWQLHGKRQADAKAKYAKIADEISAINYGKPGTTADAAETAGPAVAVEPAKTLDEQAMAALEEDAARRAGATAEVTEDKRVIDGGGIGAGADDASGSQLGAIIVERQAEVMG
jgi:hypothetical protein